MNKGDFFKGALVGAIAGAVAGILFAPKSGKKTREDIKNYLGEMKDKIADKASEIKNITAKKYHQIVESVVAGYQEAKKVSEDEAKQIKKDLKQGYKEAKRTAKK